MDASLEDKFNRLRNRLAEMGSVLLAFSGGVDSSLLLAVGIEVLGSNTMAATVHSPLHPEEMLERAATLAGELGAQHITLAEDEPGNDTFAANPPERCYICKHGRYSKLIEIAAREGIAEVIEGSQVDDLQDYRPGLEAARELGVRSPLLEADLSKYEVRELSKELGLSTWNLPAAPCLATRIPYNQRITREKLQVVEKGESLLKELGFAEVRLRFIEERTARIEVPPPAIPALVSDGTREKVLKGMRELGFIYTTLDLGGYRPGALNEAFEDV